MGSAVTVGMVALFGCNMTTAADIVVKASAVDNEGSSDVHLSSTLSMDGTQFRSFIYFLTPVSARYYRIEIEDTSLSYLEVGRLVLGAPFEPTHGIAFGHEQGFVRSGRRTLSAGGQQWLATDYNQRSWRCEFRALLEAEVNANFDALQQYSGQFKDILICKDKDSSNLARDTIFGTIENAHSIRSQEAGLHDIVFDVRERL